nr:sulfite exporter TauE/SafE family protein [Desulfobacula sp.]
MSDFTSALNAYALTPFQWGVVCCCAFIFALAKGGVKGVDIFAVPIMAIILGSKASTGIVLPMLLVGDIFSVWYYNRAAKWYHLRKLAVWIVLGILLAVWIGKDMPEAGFKYALAGIILSSILILLWLEQKKDATVPNRTWFSVVAGLFVGFTTMVGNVGGAFANILFPSNEILQRAIHRHFRMVVFLVNVFKVPFHVVVWKTITWQSLAINLVALPFIALGLWVGVYLVKIIKEKYYRRMVLILTALGAILIFLK